MSSSNTVTFILLFTILRSVIGELTCYCNLPSCISSGFTCKTSAPGRCFFYIEEYSRISVHGCTHLHEIGTQNLRCDYLLPYQTFKELVFEINRKQKHIKETRDQIQGNPPTPVIGCCQKTMCNHRDYTRPIENRLESIAKNHYGNKRLHTQSSTLEDRAKPSPERCVTTNNGLYTDQEVWFRAAVIAVPISGGFIMIILIFIAIRLLKREDVNSKFNQHYKPYDTECNHEIVSITGAINPSGHFDSGGQETLSNTSQSGGEYLLGKHNMSHIGRDLKSSYSNSFPYSDKNQNVKAS